MPRSRVGRGLTEGTRWFWNLPDFLCKSHRKMLRNSKLRGGPQVNLSFAAWNCVQKRLSNNISCKRVSTIKGNEEARCAEQTDLEVFCPFLLDVWQWLGCQQISFFHINTPQKAQSLCAIMQPALYKVHSIWIRFHELYVLQTWLKHSLQTCKIISIQQNWKTKLGYLKNRISLDLFI